MKQLTVLIETTSETLEFVSGLHDRLVAERANILEETNFEVSFLRGPRDFCLATLRANREYPRIVILDHATYLDVETRDSVLNAGAALVFDMPPENLASEETFIARVHECVTVYLGQR